MTYPILQVSGNLIAVIVCSIIVYLKLKDKSQTEKKSFLCKLGFHKYGEDWYCVRSNCDMMNLGIGEVHRYD